ncbi:2,3-bisphosphoglycerate-dependent phosphoglycerate mutase [Spirosoma rhododendri]|uniref:2,3-bisphosphoglycerate-dependent phosphoglycerate mutase n=1 Tax=Spirosoma rhododendri TaxID=2728024 RepID=A0A7L5DRK2_9BACT|nr:2,3-bisphosphoglycerate-dependent phosphoglycerate mutase [Spirosoma rhododendri]QJD79863.1 2,3-bisphosphoglycerate-dependent phosphoglycerate mutase [Spirosoma rhododendri]
MPLLVLVRHGQSQFNLENRFTGSVDTPLTKLGRHEAREAGILLKHDRFTIGFTSVLQRAIDTMSIILHETGQTDLPVERNAALNERMYGDLQGTNKEEAGKRFGDDQVYRWRRSYDERPPNGESLHDTVDRVVPYFEQQILPHLNRNEPVLIVAHGNSLRALLMRLEEISPEHIETVELATGVPRQYEYDPLTGEFQLLGK